MALLLLDIAGTMRTSAHPNNVANGDMHFLGFASVVIIRPYLKAPQQQPEWTVLVRTQWIHRLNAKAKC